MQRANATSASVHRANSYRMSDPVAKFNAIQLKEVGNAAAGAADWPTALDAYEQCLRELDKLSVADGETQGAVEANASLACLKLQQHTAALGHADAAITARPGWGKAYARRAEALAALGRALDADDAARETTRLDPTVRPADSIGRTAALLRAAALAPQPLSSDDVPLNLQRLSYIALLRSGRTLAADSPPLGIADIAQKRLLTMLGIDGAIAAATEVDYSLELCACAGSRLWLLRKAKELGLDVYAQLLGGSRRREVSCDYPKQGCRAACELRLTVDPARLELHFESILRSEGDVYDGTPMVDATYLCGLSRWVCVEAGVEGVPKYRHADWSPAPSAPDGGKAVARLEQSAASRAHAERTGNHGRVPGLESHHHRMERRDIGRTISMYFVHHGGSNAPVAPPNPPPVEMFVGYDAEC